MGNGPRVRYTAPMKLFNTRLFSLLALSALAFWAVPSLFAAAPDAPLSGRVVFVDGEVTANGKATVEGALLTGPVVLKTGKASLLEVVFDDRNVFRLGANTTVKVDFSKLAKTVTVENGAFSSVLKKLAAVAGSPAFVLKTRTASAGVRGTSFHVEVLGDRTYFCTCNGEVEVADAKGKQAVTLTNAHHGSRVFTLSKGKIAVAEGGLEGHDDASMETLAQRIAVAIDWTKPDLEHR